MLNLELILRESLHFYNTYNGSLLENADISRYLDDKTLIMYSSRGVEYFKLEVEAAQRLINQEVQENLLALPRTEVESANALSQNLSYPLTDLRGIMGVFKSADATKTGIKENTGTKGWHTGIFTEHLEYVQSELFAQLYATYTQFPEALANYMPTTYDIYNKLHEVFSYGTTAKLSTSELAKPVQDVFRIDSTSDSSEKGT